MPGAPREWILWHIGHQTQEAPAWSHQPHAGQRDFFSKAGRSGKADIYLDASGTDQLHPHHWFACGLAFQDRTGIIDRWRLWPGGASCSPDCAQGSMRIRLQTKRLCPVRAAQCAPAARLAADQCNSRGADRSAARTEPSRRNKTIPKIHGGPRRSLAECCAGILDRSPASSERLSMFAPHAIAVLMVATWVM